METTNRQQESLRHCIKINIKRDWRKHVRRRRFNQRFGVTSQKAKKALRISSGSD